jgi:RNA polymerase sigma-70 factor, ECF subfamily
MPNEPDSHLLKRFAQGDEEAFRLLFRQFEVEIYRWILRIVRDPSGTEDVVVEAFWRAYRARARFDSSRSFGAWMRVIATNAARDHLRAMRSRASWIETTDEIAQPAIADRGIDQSVVLAFRKLAPKLQVVATLALIEELPYGEIADALDLPLGTVKSRVFRAVQKLRKELARTGIRR